MALCGFLSDCTMDREEMIVAAEGYFIRALVCDMTHKDEF